MNNELQSDEKNARLAVDISLKPGEPLPVPGQMKELPGGFKLLPPARDKCQTCAGDHDPSWPHNRDSLYFQYWFYAENGRWPTWIDAMSHCDADMRAFWLDGLRKLKVDEKAITGTAGPCQFQYPEGEICGNEGCLIETHAGPAEPGNAKE